MDDQQRQMLVILFSVIDIIGIAGNLFTLLYVLFKRLFRNFISPHFIGHQAFTNLIACTYLIPLFINNVQNGGANFAANIDALNHTNSLCRFHAFATCAVWSVTYYMMTCIAAVHFLTFARIHYDQLLGLHPSVMCMLTWVIGASLGLACLTNESIVSFDQSYQYCLWNHNHNGYKFLAYFLLLGILLPTGLFLFSYARILSIFYHAPVVFETLGLFKSRYLIFVISGNNFLQWPFFIGRFVASTNDFINIITLFLAFLPHVTLGILYAVSLFIIKEDDMCLSTKTHKISQFIPQTGQEL